MRLPLAVLLFQTFAIGLLAPTTNRQPGRHYNFLEEVDETVLRVLERHPSEVELSDISIDNRQGVVIARALQQRLQDMKRKQHCPICWLQTKYCCCSDCPPVDEQQQDNKHYLNRLFLIMHHGEIGMGVDTAKLILASHPTKCRLVVAGIGSQYQSSMEELEKVLADEYENTLVLFPDEASKPFHDIVKEQENTGSINDDNKKNKNGWNIIVIDGTWQQARRIKKRYFEEKSSFRPVRTTRLSDKVMKNQLEHEMIRGERNPGHQLRKHTSTSRKVGTFEAARLFLGDLHDENNNYNNSSDQYEDGNMPPSWIQMETYQQVANNALLKQNDFPC